MRYEVVLKPDLSTQALSGRETIVVKAVADIARLVFSPNALHIDNATLDGTPVTPSSTAAGIVFDLTEPLRAGGSATFVQYAKGALFLDHLRTQLGDAVFWRGIRTYTRKHAGGTVTSRDFQVAMQHASGRDLQPLFAQWVYGDVGKQ